MAWNEPPDGDKNKDPWGKNGNQGPPDLDEIVQKMQKGIGGIFGNKPSKKGNNPTFSFLIIISIIYGLNMQTPHRQLDVSTHKIIFSDEAPHRQLDLSR